MPSWNIHIAQTEELLRREGAVPRAVHDRNIFLFGNVVPDIFVGYMLDLDFERIIPYTVTHCAKSEPIPKPREWEFWERFVAPQVERARAAEQLAGAGGDAEGDAGADNAAASAVADAAHERDVLDLTLGAWAHLLADHIWNTRVHEYLEARGDSDAGFRAQKQDDFDAFGKTLHISSVPKETDALLRAAEDFPQYPIAANYAHDTIVVIHEVVRSNHGVAVHAPYQLLTDAFFDGTFHEVLGATEFLLEERLFAGRPAAPGQWTEGQSGVEVAEPAGAGVKAAKPARLAGTSGGVCDDAAAGANDSAAAGADACLAPDPSDT